ncbi:MAG: MgtC/SapB family protein [Patescibacteria group bacterium]
MNIFISSFISNETVIIIAKLLIAIMLGMLIGIERVLAHKTAGPRTHALVSMGAALFIIIGESVAFYYTSIGMNPDPLKIAGNIIVGVGFLGAGLIIFRNEHLMGLTTAAGLWVAAGIGTAVGFGLYEIAVIATVLTLFIFIVLWFVEDRIIKKIFHKDENFPNGNN